MGQLQSAMPSQTVLHGNRSKDVEVGSIDGPVRVSLSGLLATGFRPPFSASEQPILTRRSARGETGDLHLAFKYRCVTVLTNEPCFLEL